MRHLQRYEWTYEIWLKEDIAELLLGPLFSTTDAFARVVKVLVKHKSSLRSVKKVLDNCVIKWGHMSDDFEARANQTAQLNRSDIYWALNIAGNHIVPSVRKILESIVESGPSTI